MQTVDRALLARTKTRQQYSVLTDAADGKQSNGSIGWLALGEARLHNVDTEGEGHDGL